MFSIEIYSTVLWCTLLSFITSLSSSIVYRTVETDRKGVEAHRKVLITYYMVCLLHQTCCLHYTDKCNYWCISVLTHIHTCAHAHMHTQTHTHTHTHTHTDGEVQFSSPVNSFSINYVVLPTLAWSAFVFEPCQMSTNTWVVFK